MVTITGAKYASAALSSVDTTTITVSTTPFVSGDFAVARRVDLYNSAGTTFKGMAFVRAYVSTSSLQLETEFFDPKTGSTVTQVVGDTVLVSKNWADVATTGIAVSYNTVTISDRILWGTSGTVNSVAFHDEDVTVINTVTTADARLFDVAGGFITFGHLQNYSTKSWYNGCNFSYTGSTTQSSFAATSTAARMCFFGGSQYGRGLSPLYFTGGYASGAYGTDWAHCWFLQTKFENADILSKGIGGNWTTGTNHVLENCSFVGAGTNQILLRFGNGSIVGGQYKILRNSTAPISIFGSDAAGTYAIGAPAGERSIVLDIGSNNTLWRSATSISQTINITNLISTDYRLGYSNVPESSSATSATKNIYFKDIYTNLLDATKCASIYDSGWTIDDSVTASGDGSSAQIKVFESTATGHTVGTSRTPWTIRIRKYGYDEIEQTVQKVSYSLGTAGTAYNVSLGGSVNQIARTTLTDSESTALAYTGITITDHGASPVTWNSKNWSITVTVDLSVAPTRTASQVFAYIKAGISQLTTWNGKTGILWHVLMEESGSNYVTQRGVSGGAGATLKGVRIIDQSGNPFTGVVGMVADDGTTYTPPSTDTRGLQFTGLVSGSQVIVFDTGTTTEIFNTASSGTSETWSESSSGSRTVDYTIMKAGYLPIRVTGVVVTGAISGGVLATPIQQSVDRAYVASSGLTFTTNATANTSTKIFSINTATTVQNWYSFMIESWIAQSSLRNKEFPLVLNGPNSITLGGGWEWRGWASSQTQGTGVANTSIPLLSRDGMRYMSSGGSITAIWSAILTSGVPTGAVVRYQQTDGGTTQTAAITSGNMDELIQVYGDATHGNFDYTGYLVLKVQEGGYDQIESDTVSLYGSLEDQLYVVGLSPTPNSIASGNPSLSSAPTITDHGASPVTWNGKQFSITITDSAAGNTGTDIMRWLRYYMEQGGTFQGKDAFNWHDLVQQNGGYFKTVRGKLYGDTGATLKGVRVVQNDGSSVHPDFTLFTADDGTTYTPPVSATITVGPFITGSRVQLYDTANNVELFNNVVTGTSKVFSETYTVDRTIRARVSYVSGTSAKQFIEVTVGNITALNPNISAILTQVDDTVYNVNAIDGSTVTGITFTDSVTDVVNINVASGAITLQSIYAAFVYWMNTATGITNDIAYIDAVDTANYILTSMIIKNTSSPTAPLEITGGYAVDSTTGASIDLVDTTGGTLIFAPDHVVAKIVTVGGVNVITGDIADVPAKVQTGMSAQGYTSARAGNIDNLDGKVSTAIALSA